MEESNRENIKHRWYIVQCISNYEDKVKEAIENKKESENLEEDIDEVFLPKMDVKLKSGKKKTKPIFPGYLFVKMNMTDKAWFVIRNTQDVTGIIGSSGQRTKPTPITQAAIDKMIKKIEKSQIDINEEENEKISSEESKIFSIDALQVGKRVKIVMGPWTGQVVTIDEIDEKTSTISAKLEIFGKVNKANIPISYLGKVGVEE